MELPFVSRLDDPALTARTVTTRAVVEAFTQRFYVERDLHGAFEAFVREDYVQHSPTIADGRAAAIAALEGKWSNPDLHLRIDRILVDGDHAFLMLHAWVTGQRGAAVLDVYRVQDGKLAEHWDFKQEFPRTAANDHPLL